MELSVKCIQKLININKGQDLFIVVNLYKTMDVFELTIKYALSIMLMVNRYILAFELINMASLILPSGILIFVRGSYKIENTESLYILIAYILASISSFIGCALLLISYCSADKMVFTHNKYFHHLSQATPPPFPHNDVSLESA